MKFFSILLFVTLIFSSCTEPTHLDSSNYDEYVSQDGIVMVDFYGEWCPPCKKLTPILEEIKEQFDVKLYKVDIDKSKDLAERFNIKFIPTVIFYKDGELIGSVIGLYDKETYINIIETIE